MMVFTIWIEHALNVTVKRPHDAECANIVGAPERRYQDQRLLLLATLVPCVRPSEAW